MPKLKSGEENAAEKRGETEMVSGRKRKDRGTRNRQLQRGQTGVGSSLDKFLEDVPFPFNLAGGLVKVGIQHQIYAAVYAKDGVASQV